MYTPDFTDETILNILQQDAKKTNKEIASFLEITTTPVYERIKRLEKNGIIDKYVALVDRRKLGYSLLALCNITLIDLSNEAVGNFETEIKQLDEVQECFHLAGNCDYFVKVIAKDMDAFKAFMSEKLYPIKNIRQIQTSFSISVIKQSTFLPIRNHGGV